MRNGMLSIYKEAGYTSNDVVAKLRGILHMRRIGHTGTLDPMAEGVLPVCLGNATRLCDMIADRDKEYRAVMRLGLRTDTQDMTGTILEEAQPEVLSALTEDRIREAAESFIGDYSQIPPMYSALKVNGQRLYDLARQGKTVERKARQIRIHELEVLEIAVPFVTMRVRCSKGTYIRTLCEDIGSRLGCGGTMDSLLLLRTPPQASWRMTLSAFWPTATACCAGRSVLTAACSPRTEDRSECTMGKATFSESIPIRRARGLFCP